MDHHVCLLGSSNCNYCSKYKCKGFLVSSFLVYFLVRKSFCDRKACVLILMVVYFFIYNVAQIISLLPWQHHIFECMLSA